MDCCLATHSSSLQQGRELVRAQFLPSIQATFRCQKMGEGGRQPRPLEPGWNWSHAVLLLQVMPWSCRAVHSSAIIELSTLITWVTELSFPVTVLAATDFQCVSNIKKKERGYVKEIKKRVISLTKVLRRRGVIYPILQQGIILLSQNFKNPSKLLIKPQKVAGLQKSKKLYIKTYRLEQKARQPNWWF